MLRSASREPDAEHADHAADDANEQFERILRKSIHARGVVHAAEAQAKMRDEPGNEYRLDDQNLVDLDVADDGVDQGRQ